MFNHNWITLPVLISFLASCLHLAVYGQSHVAIGAHRLYQKTSFSCAGRPSGYYADIETGCQVYHMCDGLGRQFSYSCPNTTLFQQRMLICDHWYMVNCSKAESDYTANLLIGQRDKPFVNDEAINLRTPRPDLLDRPYAPDYSGESFRSQYSKQMPPQQNQIADIKPQKSLGKGASSYTQTAPAPPANAGAQRWKIPPPPSRLILPPAYEPQLDGNSATNGVRFITTPSTNSRRQSQYTSTKRATTTTTTSRPTTRRIQQYQSKFHNAALHERQQGYASAVDSDDLGTSHSTRYNTSADFNSAELTAAKNYYNPRQTYKTTTIAPTTTTYRVPTTKSTTTTTTTTTRTTSTTSTTTPRPYTAQFSSKLPIKVPSKIYEPPFLYPIYNQNDTLSNTKSTSYRTSTAAPFTTAATTTTRRRLPTTTTQTTTRAPTTRPTTVAGKPFTLSSYTTPTTTFAAVTAANVGRNQNNLIQQRYEHQRYDGQKSGKEARTIAPAQGFKPPTPRPPTTPAPTTTTKASTTTNAYNRPAPFASSTGSGNGVALPSNDLLPPFADFVQHDIATTQGPPIYYEWKIPSNGLEPPKLDPPIGVDGREYPETANDYNKLSSSGGSSLDLGVGAYGIDQQSSNVKTTVTRNTDKNPFFAAAAKDSQTQRTAISRSIKDTAQPTNLITQRPAETSASTKQTRRLDTAVALGASTTTASTTTSADINELRKELSVPDFAFPLENIGRTGYLAPEAYNSFQLKIPMRRSDTNTNDEPMHWFGENPKCPECHPSYVVPGTCMPCLRR